MKNKFQYSRTTSRGLLPSDDWKEAWIIAFFIAAGSQFYIDAFTNGFIIAFSVVIFPIFLYLYREHSITKICLMTSFFSPFFRAAIITFRQLKTFSIALATVYPECIFYFSYSLIYYLLYHRRQLKSGGRDFRRFALVVFLCDWVSNVIEISLRNGFRAIPDTLYYLWIVAVFRTLLSCILITVINSSENFILQREDRRRYENLLMMNSVFQSELFMMNKSIVDIEDVMKKSFDLYRSLNTQPEFAQWKSTALEIAKDIHEIKKEYIRVIQGIQTLFDEKEQSAFISVEQLIDMISIHILGEEGFNDKKIEFSNRYHFDAKKVGVKNYYQLIPILRNLLSNAVDATVESESPSIRMNVYRGNGTIYFSIKDNGRGMTSREQKMIFLPGYSTKFDKKTGNINRGLGLPIVKDMVDFFEGSIEVESVFGKFTEFKVSIPEKNL
ncbi:ATP-binding protein [Filifactor villosus]|uniref:histidine kinase n=1 Tax=Filifactor villosus TaxID=29374 RepID=A0ABV9QMD5_9FIRM